MSTERTRAHLSSSAAAAGGWREVGSMFTSRGGPAMSPWREQQQQIGGSGAVSASALPCTSAPCDTASPRTRRGELASGRRGIDRRIGPPLLRTCCQPTDFIEMSGARTQELRASISCSASEARVSATRGAAEPSKASTSSGHGGCEGVVQRMEREGGHLNKKKQIDLYF